MKSRYLSDLTRKANFSFSVARSGEDLLNYVSSLKK